MLQAGIDDHDSSLELQAKLDDDRKLLWEFKFVFHRVPTAQPHYLPVNMHRMLQNAIQNFHIDRRKPSDLGLHTLFRQPDWDSECTNWASRLSLFAETTLQSGGSSKCDMNFRIHLRATLATRHVLEKRHQTLIG
jgi:DNA-directed RNA polymerase II subunit RPB1